MTPEIVEIIIASGFGIISAIVTELLAHVFSKKKDDADAAKSITAAATELIAPLTARIDEQDAKLTAQDKKITDQENEITYLRRKVDSFLVGIRKLIEQIRCLGQDPVWTPDQIGVGPDEIIRSDKSKK